jgi:hypothetical protein
LCILVLPEVLCWSAYRCGPKLIYTSEEVWYTCILSLKWRVRAAQGQVGRTKPTSPMNNRAFTETKVWYLFFENALLYMGLVGFVSALLALALRAPSSF